MVRKDNFKTCSMCFKKDWKKMEQAKVSPSQQQPDSSYFGARNVGYFPTGSFGRMCLDTLGFPRGMGR